LVCDAHSLTKKENERERLVSEIERKLKTHSQTNSFASSES